MESNNRLNQKEISFISSLTPLQEGMLFFYLQDPEGDRYVERLSVRILGPVDREVFVKAWEAVIAGRDVLRACFRWEEAKQPLQVTLKKPHADIRFVDGPLPGKREPFDLRQPPFRVTLQQVERERFLMIVDFHHIILDGWSTGILLSEFNGIYAAIAGGQAPPVEERIPFKTFVRHMEKRSQADDEAFWKRYLEGYDVLPPLEQWLPQDGADDEDLPQGIIHAPVEEGLLSRIDEASATLKITPATILYGAWGLLLQHYYDCGDVLFGTTVSGRQTPIEGIDKMAGLLINTVPLRIKSGGEENLHHLLQRLNRDLGERTPFEQASIPAISRYAGFAQGREPFDTLVVVENYPLDKRLKEGDPQSPIRFGEFTMDERTHYPLALHISLFGDMTIDAIFDSNRIHPALAQQMTEQYLFLLKQLTTHQVHNVHSVHNVHNVHLLSQKQKQDITAALTGPTMEINKTPTLRQCYRMRAAAQPDAVALIDDEENHHLTHRRLFDKASSLSRRLAGDGASPGRIVAVMAERSKEMMVGILGIVLSGAAYLPLDPGAPAERIELILRDSGAEMAICDRVYPNLPKSGILIIAITDSSEASEEESKPVLEPTSTDPAYIITTSGSTGTPKGVMIQNRSAVNLLTLLERRYPLEASDVFLLKTSVCFDVSVSEIFCFLKGTGTLAILPAGMEKDPVAMARVLARQRATHVNFVPSMLRLFLSSLEYDDIETLFRLKYIFAAGEALLPDVVESFRRTGLRAKLENLYGPTEATVYSSGYSLADWLPRERVPIGRPLANMELSIRDRFGNQQPIGVPGELWIGGAGVAAGYLNRPELTEERFVAGWYKSGDLACLLPDHTIQYLGRMDQQLKIRGFRIEPGEIENRLLQHPIVKAAVVIPKPGPGGEAILAAYIVPAHTLDDPNSLKSHLAETLPDYMIPTQFYLIDDIPLTGAGKVDPKALLTKGSSLSTKTDYSAPSRGLEQQVASVWRAVLDRDRVGLDDNFFDCGGNSFSMIRLSARLKKELGQSVPVTTLFQYPTVRALARFLERGQAPAIDTSPRDGSDLKNQTIAIIGMAGRFPGAKNIETFWDNIVNSRESIRFFTREELIERGAEARLLDDRQFVPAKGVLDDDDYFDAEFFGYSPQEALMMDPQMRVFHEICFQALEDAGIDPFGCEDSIGLYAGATPNPHWETAMLFDGEGEFLEKWQALQFCDKDYLATRVAYKLNLRGPAVAVQSACSTSLLAVAMGCEALLNHHCDAVIAGGACVTIPDRHGYLYREGMILSPDGHCRAFDKEAGGTLTGNGVGAVVLKPLAKALDAHDPIRAKILGWGMNNDGSDKAGFTAPSSRGQATAIRAAIDRAGISADQIGLIEAHGSGTTLGDPIEVEGLIQAFATNKKNYCALGSVKTNIGHLDVAAGVAGLIKTVLSLQNHILPPSLHYNEPNPAIDFKQSPFFVNTTARDWDGEERRRIAGVSSFGLGGTNVHVLLEEHIDKPKHRGQAPSLPSGYHLLPLSAQSDGQLGDIARGLANYLKTHPEARLDDVSFTLASGRRSHGHRGIVVCRDAADGIAQLEAEDMLRQQAGGDDPFIIFMFSGQGNQYVNMCHDLYESEPVFRQEMQHCFAYLKNDCDIDIEPVLYPSLPEQQEAAVEAIQQFIYTSPIKFSIEYALAKLLLHWGIRPAAMIGHSFGEYVAATLAGVFSLEDALHLSALRGRLMQRVPEGAMLSVPLSERELDAHLSQNLWLAAINGPSMSIVSGTVAAVDTLKRELEALGHECLSLKVPRAGHSAMMRPIIDEFKRAVAAVTRNEPNMPYISGLSGQWITASEAMDPDYWGRHLELTIRFYDGVTTLFDESDPVFIQVGPGRGLSLFVSRHPKATAQTPIVNMVRHHKEAVDDRLYTLQQIGRLWMSGLAIDWSPLFADRHPRKLHLPTYPFKRKRVGAGGDITAIHRKAQKPSTAIVKNPRIEEWFYIPSWKRAMKEAAGPATEPENEVVLLLAGSESILDHLGGKLRDTGGRVIGVRKGAGFRRESRDRYMIDPFDPASYEELLESVESGGGAPTHIIHAWGLESDSPGYAPESPAMAVEAGEPYLLDSFYSVLFLVKAVLQRQWNQPIELDIVTGGVFDVTGNEGLSPRRSPVSGLLPVIGQECPNIHCRLIDTDSPERLASEVFGGGTDPVVALRGKHRWIQDFQQVSFTGAGDSMLKKHGVYLVTGGLGDIGMILAERLAEQFAARLVLVGRSPFPAEEDWERYSLQHSPDQKIGRTIRSIRNMEAGGARVAVRQADVSDVKQMKAVLDWIDEEFGVLDGVIHSAGIVGEKNFRSLGDVTLDDCAEQFRAKVSGALVLEELLRDRDYDFCLLMSSTASVLGGLGFGAYASANCFLDAMATAHNREGKNPWYSVNWDGWQIPGANEDLDADARLGASIAHLAMTPDEGFDVFKRILAPGFAGQVIQSTGDLQQRMDRWGQVDEIDDEPVSAHENERSANNRPRPRLQNQYVPPEGTMQQTLAGIWANVLGFDRVGVEDNFFELGGDSLKAVIVTSRIQKELDVKVSLKDFFQEPTIAALSRGKNKEEELDAVVPPAEILDYYPLSAVQERMALLHKMEPESVAYNLPTACRLKGRLDVARLEEAFVSLIDRHESLRTSFHDTEEGTMQTIHPAVEFRLERLDGDVELPLEALVRPFDLTEAPLLRATLQPAGHEEYLLLVDMPHIVSDGGSMAVMMKELLDLYSGKSLPAKSIDYKDVVMWRRSEEQRQEIAAHEAFWRDELAGELPVLNLPLDYLRPPRQSFEGNVSQFKWDRDTASGLKQLAQHEGATLYMVLLSIYSILLSKLSGQEEILLGTPSAGRQHPELLGIVGMFINTVVLRQFPKGSLTFREFLGSVKSRTLTALEHQDFPFEKIVEITGGAGDQSRNPLFDAVFVLQNIGVPEMEIPGLKLEAYPVDSATSKFDLTMRVEERDDGLLVYFEYRTRLFKEGSVARWADYIRRVAEAVLKQPDIRLRDIEVMGAEEKEWLLHTLNDTAAAYPRQETIHHLFQQQVSARPHAAALVGPGSPEEGDAMLQLTYDCLNRRANAVAGTLKTMGTGAGSIVALSLDRSVDMMAAIVGVLKAGGAYLPMDPSLPPERIDYMLEDSGATVVVNEEFLQMEDCLAEEEALDGACAAAADDPAYVIYTSGTTGKPKGVLVGHRNVVRLLFNDRDVFDFSEADIWTLFHSYCFDFSVWEMYGALLMGGKLVMAPKLTARDTRGFLELLARQSVTILKQTPSAFYSLSAEEAQQPEAGLAVRMVIFGGEALKPLHLKDWSLRYPQSRLVNMYGITETTVHVTYKEIGPAEIDGNISNIGGPIPTLSCYVADRHGNLCPTGVAGELMVGGDGVARGYLNRPELTHERFVQLENLAPGSRLFRSGDLARVLPGGDMEYLGRIDHQVKIRGFRIELGEIESHLLKHEDIKEAVVAARKNGGNEESLCAYFVLRPDAGLQDSSSLLREYLKARLPEYMVPSYFMELAGIPLTANGKVDRRSLPEPTLPVETSICLPRNRVERALAEIWSNSLNIHADQIGIDNNFFELGGHSLKATLAARQIHKEIGVDVPLREMFRTPTIRDIAAFIDKQERSAGCREIEPVEKRDYYPVSSAQERMYILNKLKGDDTSDNTPQALELDGDFDINRFERVVRDLAARHEALRTSFFSLDGVPVQRIHSEVELDIQVTEAGDDEIAAVIQRFIRPFDLSSAPLLRVELIAIREQKHILLYDIHHIVRDGTSTEIFFREFVRLYRGESLPELTIQYKDFALWRRRKIDSGDLVKQEDYWAGVYDGPLPELELPADFPRPETQSFEGKTKEFVLDESLTRAVQSLASAHGCTLFMTLLAAYNILLSKYSGQEDVVVGTPVAGRPHADLRDVIGMFINTLAIRNYPAGEKSFGRFLDEVRIHCIEAFENQDLPFDHLVSRLGIEPDPARQPLFDTMFVVQNVNQERGWEDVALDGLVMRAYPFEQHVAQFDIITHVFEREREIAFKMLYCTKLFKPETIDSVVERFVEILETVSLRPETLIRDIDVTHGFCRQEIELPDAEFVF